MPHAPEMELKMIADTSHRHCCLLVFDVTHVKMEKIYSVLLPHACLYVSDVALHWRSESPSFFLVSFL